MWLITLQTLTIAITKIYRECTKQPFNFDSYCLILIKITVTDQIKILNRKIMQNEAQYDLDRKVAEISALFSNNLDKYEYLIGQDLGLKPSTVEQTKFEYSPFA